MQTLKHFQEFIIELTESNSKLHKQSILKKYSEDEIVKKYLYFIYNPYIVTGISTKKLSKEVVRLSFDYQTVSVFALLDYLKQFNTGTDSDIALCHFVLAKLDSTLNDLLSKIITKSLTLGIDAKTINLVIPGLIPQFSVQLANKYFDNPKIVEGKQFALTTKIDGGRITALKKNGEVSFYTRAGQKYEGLVDLEQEMSNKLPENLCLDGEITLIDKGNLTSKEQYKQTMMITRKDGEKHGVKMLVFDCMTADEFKNQKCTKSYLERRKMLDCLHLETCTYFESLPLLYVGTDTSKILEYLKLNVNNGEEGVMINICDAPYEFKRTNNLLKVKTMQDIDLPIVGFEEGEGRHVGRLGAILVEYKGNIVKVGSGFSDELRNEIWLNQDKWLGRTCSIQYFEETKNQNGGISLRFPVYLDWRDDK